MPPIGARRQGPLGQVQRIGQIVEVDDRVGQARVMGDLQGESLLALARFPGKDRRVGVRRLAVARLPGVEVRMGVSGVFTDRPDLFTEFT